MKHIIFFFILIISLDVLAQDDSFVEEIDLPPQIRYTRAYGDDETKPPFLLISDKDSRKYDVPDVSSSISFEFDVKYHLPPNLYIEFVHCDVNWKETENVFLTDISSNRTSYVEWDQAPQYETYYNFRGRVKVPDNTVKFKHGGNWKAKIYQYYEGEDPLAELKFFVIKPKTFTTIQVFPGYYQPEFEVTNTAINLEAIVETEEALFDEFMHTAVFFRNARWNEPLVVTNNNNNNTYNYKYRYYFPGFVSGFAGVQRRFRITNLPTQNMYRFLDMNNPAEYPVVDYSVRLPLSDIIRNGNYLFRDNDGLFLSRYTSNFYDDYVNVEFVMDPMGRISDEEVFVVGSFNNWLPSREWQMYYDEEQKRYIARAWVRRGVHNYLYASGTFNFEEQRLEDYSYDQYEGNAPGSYHTFYVLIYYRNQELGGFDEIIGLGRYNYSTLNRGW